MSGLATRRLIDAAARLDPADRALLNLWVNRGLDNERLTGLTGPTFAGKESTLPELKERVTKTIQFLKSVKPEQVDGSEGRAVHLKLGPSMEVDFKGQPYLLHFVLPNIFFHITTAYALLRHNGVELGKRDYIGRFITE